MEHAKYIVLSDGVGEFMFTFPSFIQYKNLVEEFKQSLVHSLYVKPEEVTVVSAGFINIEKNACFGESVSLRVKSRGDKDSAIFQRNLCGVAE